ncbi:MAG: ATP-binding protein [Bacteroidales bacterium]|nr:ATP-binding protein [Bacteroidales bacterium]
MANTEIDSLQNLLENCEEDSECYAVATELHFKHLDIDNSKALHYAQIAHQHVNKAPTRDHANACFDVGNVLINMGDIELGIAYFDTALIIGKWLDDSAFISYTLNAIGSGYGKLEAHLSALYFYLEALKFAKDDYALFHLYYNIGGLYSGMKNDTALFYFDKYLELVEDGNHENHRWDAYSNYAYHYAQKQKYDEAIKWLEKALPYNPYDTLNNISVSDYIFISQVFLVQGKIRKAKKYLKLADDFGYIHMNLTNKKSYSKVKFVFDTTFGNYNQALVHYTKYAELMDTIAQNNYNSKLANYQAKYDLERKESTIKMLHNENELKSLKLKNNRLIILLIGSVALLITLLFLVFVKYYMNKLKSEKRLKKLNDDLRNTQIELQSSNEELKTLTESLSLKNQDLLKTLENKDKFVSILAHDINGTLNVITGLSEFLVHFYDKTDAKTLKDYINQIHTCGMNLGQLVHEILQWNLSATNIEYKPKQFDIHGVCINTINYLSSVTESKHIQLQLNIPSNTMVFADPHMIFTVMRNLISNAIKFSNEGGKITINSIISKKETYFEVVDEGCGMTQDQQKRLFEAGGVPQRIGTKKEKGFGFGLAICKEFIEKNNGKIGVTSIIEQGSTFWFTLPLN